MSNSSIRESEIRMGTESIRLTRVLEDSSHGVIIGQCYHRSNRGEVQVMPVRLSQSRGGRVGGHSTLEKGAWGRSEIARTAENDSAV